MPIPDALGIDNDGYPLLALIKATGLVHTHAVFGL